MDAHFVSVDSFFQLPTNYSKLVKDSNFLNRFGWSIEGDFQLLEHLCRNCIDWWCHGLLY